MADSNPSIPSSKTQQPHQILSATYQSPTNAPFTLTQEIPFSSSSSPSTDPDAAAPPSATDPDPAPTQRASYLGALRRATATLQEQINTHLTARMEEDNKARDAAAAAGAAAGNGNASGIGSGNGAGVGSKVKKGVDEDKEEDNYGEEVVDDDE